MKNGCNCKCHDKGTLWKDAQRQAIKSALIKNDNVMAAAARELGLTIATTRRHAVQMGLWPKAKKTA
jgi:transcriptional regulator with GAF, ATPase, and Fis domain